MRLKISRTPASISLLVIITAVFALEFARGAIENEGMLIRMGAIVPGTIYFGHYWRLLAAMFLHATALHWAANCWALYQLGTLYEAMFGSRRFLLVYFVTGLVASAASSLFTNAVSVGASGAILGILGAFIFSILRSPVWRHESWTKSLVGQLAFWAIINIALGFTVDYIDNVAHIAGLATGLLLGFIPHRVPPPPPSSRVIDVAYDESPLPRDQH
jgi:rhomboid protease GluP